MFKLNEGESISRGILRKLNEAEQLFPHTELYWDISVGDTDALEPYLKEIGKSDKLNWINAVWSSLGGLRAEDLCECMELAIEYDTPEKLVSYLESKNYTDTAIKHLVYTLACDNKRNPGTWDLDSIVDRYPPKNKFGENYGLKEEDSEVYIDDEINNTIEANFDELEAIFNKYHLTLSGARVGEFLYSEPDSEGYITDRIYFDWDYMDDAEEVSCKDIGINSNLTVWEFLEDGNHHSFFQNDELTQFFSKIFTEPKYKIFDDTNHDFEVEIKVKED